MGILLFNDEIIYIKSIDEDSDCDLPIKIKASNCDYFHILYLLILLEEESYKYARKYKYNAPKRDQYFSNLEKAISCSHSPFPISCQSVIAFKRNETYDVIIQTRSGETINFGGCKAAMPSFGLCPVPHHVEDLSDTRKKDIIFYNFIKEYCEGLFDYEELLSRSNSKRPDPFWFYDSQEVKPALEINRLIEEKLFSLIYLGFCFDAFNGSANISILAIIDDDVSARKIKSSIKSNWEATGENNEKAIEFVDINILDLSKLIKNKNYHNVSLFSLDLAIQYLKNNR